jgi:hypothetical protein
MTVKKAISKNHWLSENDIQNSDNLYDDLNLDILDIADIFTELDEIHGTDTQVDIVLEAETVQDITNVYMGH